MRGVVGHALGFLKHIYDKKSLIYELTVRDFSYSYSASYLGNFWAVLDSLLFILVLWFVFGLGLRGGRPIEGVPFIAYLTVGFLPYWFFVQTLNNGTNVLKAYSYLLQQADFRPSILAVVVVLSNIIRQLCVVLAGILILVANGIWPSIYWVQSTYYLFALSLFVLGIIWITSSISPFLPDINNIINVVTRFIFFGSPIFWSIERFPEKIKIVLALNPLYYVIVGYRESFIYHKPLWEHPVLTGYFWTLTVLFISIGMVVYLRLKPYFLDEL